VYANIVSPKTTNKKCSTIETLEVLILTSALKCCTPLVVMLGGPGEILHGGIKLEMFCMLTINNSDPTLYRVENNILNTKETLKHIYTN